MTVFTLFNHAVFLSYTVYLYLSAGDLHICIFKDLGYGCSLATDEDRHKALDHQAEIRKYQFLLCDIITLRIYLCC